ncbi:PQQ-binding-like beta-propeller repeat protein [Microcella sp.]|uniref:outer membrane protein assembly factor BamB family protein n=1 Tax=Microcella sp. TaxID=1913979 RepID=UPI0039189977
MTTGGAEPSPETAPETAGPRDDARSRTPAWVPWVVTPLVVLMLGTALDAVDLVAPEVSGGSAARFVPPDGQRSVTIDAQGVQNVTEHTRSIGIEGIFAAPSTIAANLLGSLGDEAVRSAQWWRSSTVTDRGERGADLFRLSSDGVTQVASWGGPIGFVFEPAIVLLPPEVQPGDAWSSTGSALPGGVLTYSAEFAALRADGPFTDQEGREIPLTGGCIGVESTVRIENVDEGISTTLAESTVWCPGRGAVWSSGTVDGQPAGRAEVRPGALEPLGRTATAAATFGSLLDPAARLLPGRTLPIAITDPFFGASDVTGQYPVAPAATADGRLVVVNDRGDDVQVLALGRAQARLAWFGHPGGTVVAVGTAGDLVVATTSRRQVVAYDAAGRRLWNWAADELVIAAPVAVPAGGSPTADIVVAARSGTVTRLDARTGTARWSQSLGADARAEVVVVDDLVLVADERERLTALDAATGAVLWLDELGLVVELAAAGGPQGIVVAMLESGEVIALDRESGDERWSTGYTGLARGVLVVGDAVVVLTDEAVVALDAGGGAVRWRGAGGEALVGEGAASVVAIVRAADVELRSTADGAVIDAQPIDTASIAASRSALAVGAALVVLESDGVLRRWELR